MTLNEYCTGIADAIREKEGSTGLIPAPDHAARIKAITTGVDTSADTVVADALTEGYTAHDAAGNLVNGANPYAKEETNTTVNTQADLIAQIQTALEGKAAGGGSSDSSVETIDVTISKPTGTTEDLLPLAIVVVHENVSDGNIEVVHYGQGSAGGTISVPKGSAICIGSSNSNVEFSYSWGKSNNKLEVDTFITAAVYAIANETDTLTLTR